MQKIVYRYVCDLKTFENNPRNNASTMASQLIDTIIFTTIAFYGIVDNLIITIIIQYIVKLILAALDTPFFYFFTRRVKTEEVYKLD